MERVDKQLETVLEQQFLSDIVSFRKNYLETLGEILDNMSGMFSTSFADKSVSDVVSVGIDRLREVVEQGYSQHLKELIFGDIHSVAGQLPEYITYSTAEPQFQPGEEQEVKSVKNVQDHSSRQIPLKNLAAYHLFDNISIYKAWIDEDERLLMRIVLELEQIMGAKITDPAEEGSPSSGLQQLLKVLHNQIEERKNVLEEQMHKAGTQLRSTVNNAVAKTGQRERRIGYYHENRVQKIGDKTKQKLNEYVTEWHNVNISLLKKTGDIQQFSSFCETLKSCEDTFNEEINAYFNELFFDPLKRLKEKLENTRGQMSWHKNRRASASEITNYRERLTQFISRQVLKPVQASLEKQGYNPIFENFSTQVLHAANQVNEKALFISKLQTGGNPPEIKSREIEWRLLVERGVREQILSDLRQEKEKVDQQLDGPVAEIREMEEIIDINLESAAKVSGDPVSQDDPHEIVDEALERTGRKLEKILAGISKTRETLIRLVWEGRKTFTANMMDLLYRSDAKALSMLDAKYKVGEKTETWRTKTNGRWERVKNRALALARFAAQKAKHFFSRAGIYIGLKKEEVKEEKKADIAAFLNETERRLSELPYVYRQLFSIDELSDRRFYIGVNENFAAMRQAYERWIGGQPLSCAIIGEKGSGKSTYMELVRRELFTEIETWHIGLHQTCWTESALVELFSEQVADNEIQTVDDLVAFLNGRQRGIAILFEGMHNLYLRNLKGYEGIEKLIYLISETSENIFWVGSCSRYAWAFLDEVVDLHDYFSQVIQTDALDEKQVQNVILNRHRTSGYDLAFEPDEEPAKNKKTRKSKEDKEKEQNQLKENYFKALTELAEGNASVAMIFWVRSIRDFDDTHLHIAPLEAASLKMLDDLQPPTLFALAALVLHDTLTPGELAPVLGINEKESKLVVNQLKAKGILVAGETEISLNHLMYRQTIRELKERNILHLE